ncbi:hypothetical protein R6Q59_010481 [Mikania micrantha]
MSKSMELDVPTSEQTKNTLPVEQSGEQGLNYAENEIQNEKQLKNEECFRNWAFDTFLPNNVAVEFEVAEDINVSHDDYVLPPQDYVHLHYETDQRTNTFLVICGKTSMRLHILIITFHKPIRPIKVPLAQQFGPHIMVTYWVHLEPFGPKPKCLAQILTSAHIRVQLEELMIQLSKAYATCLQSKPHPSSGFIFGSLSFGSPKLPQKLDYSLDLMKKKPEDFDSRQRYVLELCS